MSNKRVHITQRDNGWATKTEGNQRASRVYPTQAEAEANAKANVRRDGGGEVIIHGRDGRIRDSDTVAPANDPNPPKDQKH